MSDQTTPGVRRVIAVLKCQPWSGARIVAEDDTTLTVTKGTQTWTLSKARDRYDLAIYKS